MTRNPRRIITHKFEWRGILLVVRHQTDYLWPGTSHVEIYVARPKWAERGQNSQGCLFRQRRLTFRLSGT